MNSIFSYFISREYDSEEQTRKRKAYGNWFVSEFPSSEFSGEDRIMYKLVEYALRLGVAVRERYVDIYIKTELRTLVMKEHIKVAGTEQLQFEDINQAETLMQITSGALKSSFYGLQSTIAEVDDFAADADAFMNYQLNERLMEVYTKGYEIMAMLRDGKIGSQDALEYTKFESEKLYDIYDREKLEELGISANQDLAPKMITDTGLPTIDQDCIGLYEGELWGVEAGQGAGKTRLANGCIAYRAATVFKKNVAIYAMEQLKEEIESILISRHIIYLFGKQIPNVMIYKNTVPEDLKPLVETARLDLFESDKYGKIKIYDKQLYIESLIGTFRRHDDLDGPFNLIVIDYMALIEQKGEQFKKALMDFQVTRRAYIISKRYVRQNRKGMIAINQLTTEGSDKANAGKKTGAGNTAGGAEARRSADYTLVLGSTPELEAQNKRKIDVAKSRNSVGKLSVIVDTRMGSSYFFQSADSTTL